MGQLKQPLGPLRGTPRRHRGTGTPKCANFSRIFGAEIQLGALTRPLMPGHRLGTTAKSHRLTPLAMTPPRHTCPHFCSCCVLRPSHRNSEISLRGAHAGQSHSQACALIRQWRSHHRSRGSHARPSCVAHTCSRAARRARGGRAHGRVLKHAAARHLGGPTSARSEGCLHCTVE